MLWEKTTLPLGWKSHKTGRKKLQQQNRTQRIYPTWWSSLAFVWPSQKGCLHHLLLILAPLFQHNSLFRYPWWLGCRPNHSLLGLQGKSITYTLKYLINSYKYTYNNHHQIKCCKFNLVHYITLLCRLTHQQCTFIINIFSSSIYAAKLYLVSQNEKPCL